MNGDGQRNGLQAPSVRRQAAPSRSEWRLGSTGFTQRSSQTGVSARLARVAKAKAAIRQLVGKHEGIRSDVDGQQKAAGRTTVGSRLPCRWQYTPAPRGPVYQCSFTTRRTLASSSPGMTWNSRIIGKPRSPCCKRVCGGQPHGLRLALEEHQLRARHVRPEPGNPRSPA